jgi:hypothetical protein
MFQGRSSVSLSWRKFKATKHQLHNRKCWKNREIIHEDRRRIIHELADTVGISYGVCQEILRENLNMSRIAAKFVPRLLTNDQKQRRVNVCLELRLWSRNKATIVTVEGPTITKRKKARQVWSSTKSMLIVFFDVKGIVHREWICPS